jgi:hypothetical protein
MKNNLSGLVFIAVLVAGAQASSPGTLTYLDRAIEKVIRSPSYSWRVAYESTMTREQSSRTSQYNYRGVTELGGYTVVHTTIHYPVFWREDSETSAIIVYCDNACVAQVDGKWRRPEELTANYSGAPKPRPDAGVGGYIYLPMPHRILSGLSPNLTDIRQDKEVITATLSAPGAQALFMQHVIMPATYSMGVSGETSGGRQPRRRIVSAGKLPQLGDGIGYKDDAGTIKFWVRDGIIDKYELRASVIQVSGPREQIEHSYDIIITAKLGDFGDAVVSPPQEAVVKLSSR